MTRHATELLHDGNRCRSGGSAPDLSSIVATVYDAREKIEASFCDASAVVLGVNNTVSNLANIVEPLGVLSDNLSDVEDLSRRMTTAMNVEAEEMGLVSDALKQVAQPMGQLDRIIRTIGLVGLSARVAAGSVGTNTHIHFVEDLRALAKDAESQIKVVHSDLRGLSQDLNEIKATQQAFKKAYVDRFDSFVSLDPKRQKTVEQFAVQANSVAALASSISMQATDSYGDLAMAFFAGDSVSQRLDHVGSCLRFLEQGENHPDVAELQARQIEGALAELKDNLSLISVAHSKLSRSVQQFNSSMLQMVSSEDASDGSLAHLQNGLSRAMAILISSQAQRRGLDKEIAAASHKLDALFERISNLAAIEKRLQLISLNLSINCQNSSGEHRTLATIASQMMDLAAETRRNIAMLMDRLKGVQDRARQFRRSAERDTAGEIRQLGASAAEPLSHLDSVLNKLDLSEELQNAMSELERCGQRMSALKTTSQHVKNLQQELRNLPIVSDVEVEQSELDRLRTTYTMQAERDIHDAYLAERYPHYVMHTPQEDLAPKLELF